VRCRVQRAGLSNVIYTKLFTNIHKVQRNGTKAKQLGCWIQTNESSEEVVASLQGTGKNLDALAWKYDVLILAFFLNIS
jgi:hypothetical protein